METQVFQTDHAGTVTLEREDYPRPFVTERGIVIMVTGDWYVVRDAQGTARMECGKLEDAVRWIAGTSFQGDSK